MYLPSRVPLAAVLMLLKGAMGNNMAALLMLQKDAMENSLAAVLLN